LTVLDTVVPVSSLVAVVVFFVQSGSAAGATTTGGGVTTTAGGGVVVTVVDFTTSSAKTGEAQAKTIAAVAVNRTFIAYLLSVHRGINFQG
jgi:hypothetical protein